MTGLPDALSLWAPAYLLLGRGQEESGHCSHDGEGMLSGDGDSTASTTTLPLCVNNIASLWTSRSGHFLLFPRRPAHVSPLVPYFSSRSAARAGEHRTLNHCSPEGSVNAIHGSLTCRRLYLSPVLRLALTARGS